MPRELGMIKDIYSDRLRGVLSLLVLKTLASRGPLHGYGITSHVHVVSNELIRVEEGSLYPALHRMEQEGLVKAQWGVTDKNRRARFYTLTPKGRKRLQREEESWFRLTDGVRRVFRYA
jgi:PadR family transcriptional regulator PadR